MTVQSKKVFSLFREYSDYHQHPVNLLTHKIAIPLIVFHVLAMLDWIVIFSVGDFTVRLSYLAWLASVAWYAMLHRTLAFLMAVLLALVFPLARIAPVWSVVLAALIGWFVQLAGHVIWEKRQPAFMTNIVQTLIGPLYFVASVVRLPREYWASVRCRR